MIQPTAPTLASGLVQTAGVAGNAGAGAPVSASAGASSLAENPSFAALLEGGTTANGHLVATLDASLTLPAPASPPANSLASLLASAVFTPGKPLDPLIAALRAGNGESQTDIVASLAGKEGKAAGKNLPTALPSLPEDAGSAPDLARAPGDAIADVLGVPIGLAGILALPVPQLPGQAANTASPASSTSAAATAAPALTPRSRPAAPIEALLARRAALSSGPAADGARGTAAEAASSSASPSASSATPLPGATSGMPVVTFGVIEIVPLGDPHAGRPATPLASLQADTTASPAATPDADALLPGITPATAAKAGDASEVPAAKGRKADKLAAALPGATQPSARDAIPPAIGADITTGSGTGSAAAASGSTISSPAAPAAATDAPQDFATLMGRLAQAREAGDPHLVRTSLAHGEFGRVSLQFRHDDAGMAVTMASADPDFTRSVQAAAAASLAGGNAGTGDQPRGDTSQSQTAAQGGPGNGNGAGAQNQQGRADQAGRNVQREAETASRSQNPEASSPRRSRDGTRPGGGVYA